MAQARTLVASGARTVTFTTEVGDVPEAAAAFYLNVTAASGTSPTLDVVIQAKDPASATYYTVATFAQKTTTGSERVAVSSLPDDNLRVSSTIGGTTPSFTFTVSMAAK